MTNEEINEFLAELEAEDPGCTNLSKENIAKIQEQEAEELEGCIPGEDITTDKAWGWAKKQEITEVDVKHFTPALKSHAMYTAQLASKKAAEKRIEAKADKNRRKHEIVEEALNSKLIDLNSPISVEHKKLLIKLLTNQYTVLMEKQDKYINTNIERVLKRAIPNDLMNMYIKYPDLVTPFVGFDYVASKEYGEGLTFKVTPKIPHYFQPEDCNRIVRELLPEANIISLDKAVAYFYKYKSTRAKQEIKTAEALAVLKTYYDLVKKNPFWYDTLAQEIVSNNG